MSKEKINSVPLLPINGRILVEPEEAKQTQSKSGLYLAESSSSSEKPQRGIVVRLGLEKVDESGNKVAFNVKVGMTVMFARYAGDMVEFDDKKYLLMEEKDILAIFED